MSKQQLDPKTRRRIILEAAIKVCRETGLHGITRNQIAQVANVGDGTVNLHFNTMPKLRDAVMRHAVRIQDPAILAEMLVHPKHKKKLSDANKKLAIDYLLGQ